jgi:hypothetical protein
MMISVTPPTTSIAYIALDVFGNERLDPGVWWLPCIIHAEGMAWADVVAGLTLIDEEANKKGIEARFSSLTLQEFVTMFRPKGR